MLGRLQSKQESYNKKAKKYMWDLDNKVKIGAVLFYLPYREIQQSICTSTQAGCLQGCNFCATAGKTFYRNLDVKEIVGQVQFVVEDNPFLKGTPFEIAFMATGEPFLNYDNVVTSIKEVQKLYSSFKQVNLSTIGIVDAIYKFADENFESIITKLQISLDYPDNEKRNLIMPSKIKGTIEELLKAGEFYSKKKNRKVCLNYLLLKGFNDDEKTIYKLIQLILPYRDFFYIKLSRLNETETNLDYSSPDESIFERIKDRIIKNGIQCKIFFGDGNDIAGNCGQLFLEK